MFLTGGFEGAAAQEYDVLMGSGDNVSKLSANEGAVRMAVDLALDSAKALAFKRTAIPAVQGAAARYDAAVNSILGFDPAAAERILPQILYATTVRGDISNQAAGTIGLLSTVLGLGGNALKTVTDHVLGETPSLQTAQTMFRVLKLRDMETGTMSEACQKAEEALKKAAGKTLQSATAKTGEPELDDLAAIAGKSSHNLDAAMKRWGMQGVNYISNLLKAGRGDLAAAIPAMPTYAKAAIVAETNMRAFGLNDAAIAAQENALKADMQSPIVIISAKQIANRQAVEARKAELSSGAAPGVSSALMQKMNDAGKNAQQLKAALDLAMRNEQAVREALYKAQAAFRKNMADTAAADVLAAAIGQLQKAAAVREKAQKVFALNQQTVFDAQRKLTDAQRQAEARVEEQAKQDVEAKRLELAEARAKLMARAGGQAGEQGNVQPGQIQPGNVSKEGNALAQVGGSSIISESAHRPGLHFASQQKITEAYLNDLLLNKEVQPGLKAGDKGGAPSSDLFGTIVPEVTQLYGLRKNVEETMPEKGNKPVRALASAASATDVGYANGVKEWPPFGATFYVTDEQGNIQYGADGDVDVELVDSYPNVTPKPSQVATPTPAPFLTPEHEPTPAPTPDSPNYVIDLAGKGGYAKNLDAYPGATETTLMPLKYLMQAEAKMVIEKYPYAADQIISGNEKDKRSECVGMSRLPGVSWYPPARMKNGEYVEDRYPRMYTTVDGLYNHSTHKGDFTADTKRFDAMHLITKDFKHVVVYWNEFFDGEKMRYNVVVHDAGSKYMKIKAGMSPEEIAAVEAYNKDVDRHNANKHAEILTFEEACDKYTFVYWCAPDYIDYGDQRDPDTGELLTPK